MPYSNGPRKKSGKIVTISAFIADQNPYHRGHRVALRFTLCSSVSSVVKTFSCSLRLLSLLFGRERSVHFQQAFGQLHPYLLPLDIHAAEIRFREWHFQQPGRSIADKQ